MVFAKFFRRPYKLQSGFSFGRKFSSLPYIKIASENGGLFFIGIGCKFQGRCIVMEISLRRSDWKRGILCVGIFSVFSKPEGCSCAQYFYGVKFHRERYSGQSFISFEAPRWKKMKKGNKWFICLGSIQGEESEIQGRRGQYFSTFKFRLLNIYARGKMAVVCFGKRDVVFQTKTFAKFCRLLVPRPEINPGTRSVVGKVVSKSVVTFSRENRIVTLFWICCGVMNDRYKLWYFSHLENKFVVSLKNNFVVTLKTSLMIVTKISFVKSVN